MFGKRGQVTIFIIVAILIIAAVALFLTFKGTLRGDQTYSAEIAPIANFVQSCLDGSLEEAIYYNGIQGGYYYTPNEPVPVRYDSYAIPIYVVESESFLPSIDIFEEELKFNIESQLLDCVRNLNVSDSIEIVLENDPKTNVEIKEGIVTMETKYPIKSIASEDEKIVYRKPYKSRVDFDYFEVHSLLKSITEELAGDDLIPIGYLADLAEENGFTFGLIDLENSKLLVYLNFERDIGELPFYFHSFVFDRLVTQPAPLPNVEDIPLQVIEVGKSFSYDVKEILPFGFDYGFFYDSTDLFNINARTGIIEFTPISIEVGFHTAPITIVDVDGIEYRLLMEIEVREE